MTRVKSAGMANMTGRDNRTPFIGRTQFPTEGSKGLAQKLDGQSKDVAEVGPAPLTQQLDKTKITPMREVVTSMPTAMGSIPQIKEAGSRLASDPLVAYLKKHAQQIESNAESYVHCLRVEPLQSRESNFVGTQAEKKMQESDEALRKLFDHYGPSSPTV